MKKQKIEFSESTGVAMEAVMMLIFYGRMAQFNKGSLLFKIHDSMKFGNKRFFRRINLERKEEKYDDEDDNVIAETRIIRFIGQYAGHELKLLLVRRFDGESFDPWQVVRVILDKSGKTVFYEWKTLELEFLKLKV